MLAKGSPTSPSVVLTADKPINSSAVVRILDAIATAIGGKEKCMLGVCASCGKDTQVLFEPLDGRPVYYSDCHATTRR